MLREYKPFVQDTVSSSWALSLFPGDQHGVSFLSNFFIVFVKSSQRCFIES